jgi:alpha-tubulin suppressor-like RCC1 family protein
MNVKLYTHTSTQGLQRCAALLVVAVMLTACSGGGGSDAAPAPPPASSPSPAPPSPPAPPSASLTGPARVVANTLYSYQASVIGGIASTVTLTWGDSAADSTTTTAVQKVWHKPGSYTATLQATVNDQTVTSTQTVVVTGAPIATGLNHTCALTSASGVLCWGNNQYGQVGNGSTTTAVTSPANIIGFSLPAFVGLVAGANHTCALQTDGGASCWGRNSNGQLGNGITSTNAYSAFRVTVIGLSNAVALAAGLSHTCALQASGTVHCWGDNQYGQLGDATLTSSNTSVAVADLSDAVAIAAGDNHTCALESNGKVRCWGNNDFGQLGNGNTTGSSTGVTVANLNRMAVALTAGRRHTCVVLTDGSMQCWGQNTVGQLGNNTITDSTRPTNVYFEVDTDLPSLGVTLAAGYGHTCSLKANNNMRCWGDDKDFQLGYANPVFSYFSTPIPVSGLSDAIAVAAGGKHTCALQANGTMSCWGSNSNGQLGDSTLTGKQTPVSVTGGAIFWK